MCWLRLLIWPSKARGGACQKSFTTNRANRRHGQLERNVWLGASLALRALLIPAGPVPRTSFVK